MSTKARQEQILSILEQQGYATVKYLSDILHYSTATVNRDLNALQSRQLVSRTHGGVEPIQSRYVSIPARTHKMREEKKHIGKVAAAFVRDGETVFIDGSTTAQCMEPYLLCRRDLTVITNNIALAAKLSSCNIRVICPGGCIVEPPSMLYGPETVENVSHYRVDKMFFSTRAVSADGLIAAGIYDLMLRAVAKEAREVFYLVDHKKVDSSFHTVYGNFSAIDTVISDYDFPQSTKERYPNTRFVSACGENAKKS